MSPLPTDQSTPSSFSLSTTHLVRSIIHLTTRAEKTDAECHPQPNIDLCEKPNTAKLIGGIVVGVLGGLLVISTITVLTFLHYRNKRRDAREWPKNNQELDDYGMGSTEAPARPKNAYKQPRVDDDDDDLPAPRGPKRDSLQSLARSIRGNPEAYRARRDDTDVGMKAVEPVSQL